MSCLTFSTKHICVDHYLDVTENDFTNVETRIKDMVQVDMQTHVILVFAHNTTSINLLNIRI